MSLSHFEPKTSHNASFWGPNTLVFSEVTGPQKLERTKKEVSNGPQKVTDPIFVNPPPEGLLNNANRYDSGLRRRPVKSFQLESSLFSCVDTVTLVGHIAAMQLICSDILVDSRWEGKFGNVSETPTPTTCLRSTAVHLQFARQYAPHLYCRTFLASKLRRTRQYASHMYCSTPPICTAVRAPFVRQYFWKSTGVVPFSDLNGAPHRFCPKGPFYLLKIHWQTAH